VDHGLNRTTRDWPHLCGARCLPRGHTLSSTKLDWLGRWLTDGPAVGGVTAKEIEQVFLLARVMDKAVLGLHYRRREQKRDGQLALF